MRLRELVVVFQLKYGYESVKGVLERIRGKVKVSVLDFKLSRVAPQVDRCI